MVYYSTSKIRSLEEDALAFVPSTVWQNTLIMLSYAMDRHRI